MPEPISASCPVCGVEFDPIVPVSTGGSRRKTYCTRKCSGRARQQRAYYSEKGRKAYQAYRDAGKFAANSRRSRASRRSTRSVVCVYCGVSFEHIGSHSRVTCGSPECRRSADRDAVNVRLAKKRKVTIESFTALSIFERDQWKCGLCGQRVDQDLKYPDPLSVSLDHIVPISQDGDHSRANTQCAHLQCNLRKGRYGGGEQLALIG